MNVVARQSWPVRHTSVMLPCVCERELLGHPWADKQVRRLRLMQKINADAGRKRKPFFLFTFSYIVLRNYNYCCSWRFFARRALYAIFHVDRVRNLCVSFFFSLSLL